MNSTIRLRPSDLNIFRWYPGGRTPGPPLQFFAELRYWAWLRCCPPAERGSCLWTAHTSSVIKVRLSFSPILKFSFHSFLQDISYFRVSWYHLHINVIYPSPFTSSERYYRCVLVFIHLEAVSFSSRFFGECGKYRSLWSNMFTVWFSCHFPSFLNYLSFSKLPFLF